MIDRININQICRVQAVVGKVVTEYEYRIAKKSFFNFSPEGFYIKNIYGGSSCYSIDEIEEDGTMLCLTRESLEVNSMEGTFSYDIPKVIYKPHIKIWMSNNNIITKWFETELDLTAFLLTIDNNSMVEL